MRQTPWHQVLLKANTRENDLGDPGKLKKNNMIYTMRLKGRGMLKEQSFLKCCSFESDFNAQILIYLLFSYDYEVFVVWSTIYAL